MSVPPGPQLKTSHGEVLPGLERELGEERGQVPARLGRHLGKEHRAAQGQLYLVQIAVVPRKMTRTKS